MNARDQEKICKAGFVIIRSDDTFKPSIKFKNEFHPKSWKKLRKDFKSKKERDECMENLLLLNDYIED